MQIKKRLLLGAAFVCASFVAQSQSLLGITDSIASATQPPPPLESTWKDTRLIEAQTTKTTSPGVMVFRVMHRFGSMGSDYGGGVHTLYGFDVVTDVYLSFEFGILKNLEVGFGRSKQQELLDLNFKYRPLTQKSVGMPVSVAIYGDAGITPEQTALFYQGADLTHYPESTTDLLSYIGQVMVDRKFGNIGSLELFAGLHHRNYVLRVPNVTNNGDKDSNTIAYTGAAGRIRLSKHAAITFDYFYIMSSYRVNNLATPFYNCFSLGYEIETGGHVFEINLSNGAYINEINMIPNVNQTWMKEGFKLGFAISRAFNI
jgi:hypothetical protein